MNCPKCSTDTTEDLCPTCGLDLSETCPACNQAGYHADGCPESDATTCPSGGKGPEHREISGACTDCLVCAELWTITHDVIDGPIMYGADLLVRGADGIYRPEGT